MLEETLRICAQMWSADDGPFEGEHYRLAETICRPRPIRRPPILLGGSGEKKTLRLVARYADVWNTTSPLEQLPHKLGVLHRHCADVGRDPTEIRLSAGFFADPFADPAEYPKTARGYAELGFDLLNVGPVPGDPDPAGWVERYGEQIAPRLAEIESA